MSDRTPPRDSRRIHVPAPGAPGSGASGRAAGTTPQSRAAAYRQAPASPSQNGSGRKAPPSRPASKSTPATRSRSTSSRRRWLPRRPKLRRVLLLSSLVLPVALLLSLLGGWLYARSVYNRVEKIPLGDVLSTGGTGTNYLIVGSDTRDPQAILDAGLNPEAFEDGGGQRSDTVMLLRFADGEARMMSIPRDLYVPIAETGGSAKVNSAYNGGPRRLVLTLQQSLGLPVHHYMEVDFVSFAGLVDALGGITIDFPHPAHDVSTGLDVAVAGPNRLNGPQALAYVRSRHYVELIDGRNREDPTADLGRVQRQQAFLKAVFAELGSSRNPLTLVKAASDVSGGVRIDDTLGLTDAIRLAWRLRSLDPVSVELPTRYGNNHAGSVLFLEPEAEASLAQFR